MDQARLPSGRDKQNASVKSCTPLKSQVLPSTIFCSPLGTFFPVAAGLIPALQGFMSGVGQ